MEKVDIKRWDVVKVDLSDAVGSEQGRERVAVIIQNDIGNIHSPTTIIMPFTHVIKKLYIPTHALIRRSKANGLKMDSMILGEQMRVISKQRIINKIGTITEKEYQREIRRVYDASFGD